ncbi:unnamed protein product [Gemmata massiliana]|uniref:Uncharacterized protein n=1 Tax=Gemmata massiliana TaxID=1210884 RepID=A0A6P2D740_9BACT|nr:hypothetical protein [Gemmata massiliana]VTR95250.1 unnamed protein product [Gemmata massiliana]
MIRRSVSCSWCGMINNVDDPSRWWCANCCHRANAPMSECDCLMCQRTPEEMAAQRVEDLKELEKMLNDPKRNL